MTRRSRPRPHPPVGGSPCSRLYDNVNNENKSTGGKAYASTNASSIPCASSSPCSFCFSYGLCGQHASFSRAKRRRHTCSSNLKRCSNGSFNSVYALQISFPHKNPSNRSHRPGRERCHLARGDITCGWPTGMPNGWSVTMATEPMRGVNYIPINAGDIHKGSMNSPTN